MIGEGCRRTGEAGESPGPFPEPETAFSREKTGVKHVSSRDGGSRRILPAIFIVFCNVSACFYIDNSLEIG